MDGSRQGQLLLLAYEAGLVSPAELANFMAQVSVESGGLARLEESFRYVGGVSQITVEYARREGDAALERARIEALEGRSERLAELMYGGRIGNDAPGDGYRYRGRGYIQLTGKANYAAAGQALGLDLVAQPDLSMEPANAARIALWYWQDRVPREARADVAQAARSINGGETGLADRQQQFVVWQRALGPEAMRALAEGRTPDLPDDVLRLVAASETGQAVGALRRSDAGAPVRELQADLGRLGYLGAADIDGRFGPGTQAAVERFQDDQGLIVDGIVGPATRGRLEIALRERASLAASFGCVPEGADGVGFADSSHPQHGLFAGLRGLLPREASYDRLAQATVVCHLAGMRTQDDISAIFDSGSYLVFMPRSMLPRIAVMDLEHPPPSATESLEVVRVAAPAPLSAQHDRRAEVGVAYQEPAR